MDYQQALLNVYRSHYPNGICKNFENCSKGMPLYGHRCSIALLGCAYGNNGNPKIMFVGKEGVSDCGGATASSLYEPIAIENASPDNWHKPTADTFQVPAAVIFLYFWGCLVSETASFDAYA